MKKNWTVPKYEPTASEDAFKKALFPIEKNYNEKFDLIPAKDGTFNPVARETRLEKEYRMTVMKEALKHPRSDLVKAGVSTGSNIYGYDLHAPAMLFIPFLNPIVETTPRVTHEQPGIQANWKTILPSNFTNTGFNGMAYVNEGQRAPVISVSAVNQSAPYCTIGLDASDTFESVSADKNFDDVLALTAFLGLKKLRNIEENAIVGGSRTLKLGQANQPTGTPAGSGGSLTGSYYCYVVALSYEGVENQASNPIATGLVPQLSLTTADGQPMQINGGIGKISAVSSVVSPSSATSVTYSVVQQPGELGYAWYIGTAAGQGSCKLQAITTTPFLTLTAAPTTTGQLANAWTNTVDYSVNDGTTGGGSQQVTGMDGLLTQIFTAAVAGNSTVSYLAGATLTANGAGGIKEIDAMLENMWNNFRTTVDVLYLHAQQLKDVTAKILSTASAPLLRYEQSASGGHYDVAASGTIGSYFNPYLPGGGRTIPIIVHPTIPQGTILGLGKVLPPYFERTGMQNAYEVICRRDYYKVDYALTTRAYQSGTYSEEVIALYAPFNCAVITGIAPG